MTDDPVQQEIETLQARIRADRERVVELQRSRPPEPVADHVLEGPDGPVRLSEAFGGRDDLIVVHNMGSRCAWCTLWADGLNGVLPHLEARASFAVVSPDPPDVQQAFAASRGWRFRMLSAARSSFTHDLGFAGEKDGQAWVMPGYSTFRRAADGSIARIASDAFGPGDPYCAVYHLFDRLADGPGTWRPRLAYD